MDDTHTVQIELPMIERSDWKLPQPPTFNRKTENPQVGRHFCPESDQ